MGKEKLIPLITAGVMLLYGLGLIIFSVVGILNPPPPSGGWLSGLAAAIFVIIMIFVLAYAVVYEIIAGLFLASVVCNWKRGARLTFIIIALVLILLAIGVSIALSVTGDMTETIIIGAASVAVFALNVVGLVFVFKKQPDKVVLPEELTQLPKDEPVADALPGKKKEG
ncbi:MAG: hypothetical protein FWE53_04475 [Firmicutes bacterium]|nr:hypothetical protein [Bacillota bacterium]